MRIRKITQDDIGSLVRMIHDVMGPPDAKKALVDFRVNLNPEIHQNYKICEFYVVEIRKRIVAGGGVWSLKYDPNIARLDWFVVDPKYQRKGIATMLMKFLEKSMKKKKVTMLFAETSSGKEYTAAINFYTKNGFKMVAQIPGYWEDKTDWVYFAKRL